MSTSSHVNVAFKVPQPVYITDGTVNNNIQNFPSGRECKSYGTVVWEDNYINDPIVKWGIIGDSIFNSIYLDFRDKDNVASIRLLHQPQDAYDPVILTKNSSNSLKQYDNFYVALSYDHTIYRFNFKINADPGSDGNYVTNSYYSVEQFGNPGFGIVTSIKFRIVANPPGAANIAAYNISMPIVYGGFYSIYYKIDGEEYDGGMSCLSTFDDMNSTSVNGKALADLTFPGLLNQNYTIRYTDQLFNQIYKLRYASFYPYELI